MFLSIANVVFKIESKYKISTERQEKSYDQFYLKESKRHDVVARIFIGINQKDVPDNRLKIFESNESWSLYKKRKNYYILYMPPSFKKPLWLAKSNLDFNRIDVFCRDIFYKKSKKDVLIFNPLNYPLDQIVMIHYLSKKDGILIHSAGIRINENGYLFPGISGAGKSTISNLFLSNKFEVLSDDRNIIRRIKTGCYIYGTPWSGESGYAVNGSAKLKGIFFVEKGDKNEIIEIETTDALKRLMAVVSITWYEEDFFTRILDFCDLLIKNVPIYVFRFTIGKESLNVFEDFIIKNNLA